MRLPSIGTGLPIHADAFARLASSSPDRCANAFSERDSWVATTAQSVVRTSGTDAGPRCGESIQRLRHVTDYRSPFTVTGLAKQSRRRIPRHRVALKSVTPLRAKGCKNPYRSAKRSAQMDDCGAHADHQIESRYERRGVIIIRTRLG